jgi:hypothetical protein
LNPDTFPRTVELKVLLVLTAVVLLVHIVVLRGTPLRLVLSLPEPSAAFTTRAIETDPITTPLMELPVKLAPVVLSRKKPLPPVDTERSLPIGVQSQAHNDSNPAMATNVTKQDEQPANAEPPESTPQLSRNIGATLGAVTLPDSVRIKYQVETNKFPYRLNAELRWQQNSESYDARLELSAFGLARVQTSHGQVTSAGLAPLRFSDKYRSEVAAHFNREAGKVTFSANTPDVPLMVGAQDRLSILIQLAAMISGAPSRYPTNTVIATQTVGPRDAAIWLFTVGSEETLTLPGGVQATLKLVRNPRQEFDQKVELWLAPALGYLPARIRIAEQNGDFVDQKWLATEPLVTK